MENMRQMLEESARRYGARTAIFFKPSICYQKWSYQQLWEDSGRVASFLQQKGLKKGDRVILWAPNRPEWALSYFGCIRAGVIMVPIDTRSTADFVARVVEKTRPRLALVSRFTPESHKQLEMPKVYLEELREAIKDALSPQEVELGPDDLVEIMFTSGTTGDPKGVMTTHRNLLSNLEAALQYLPCTTSNHFLSLLPLSHLFEQMGGFLAPLRSGSTITYLSSRQPTAIFRTLQERHITHMLLVPQVLDMFMKGIEREVRRQGKERAWGVLLGIARRLPFNMRRLLFSQLHKRMGGNIDLLVSGGAALDPELKDKWELMGFKVIQGYGATEASPIISCQTREDRHCDSVGRPVPGVEVDITSDGEVLVKGSNITPGYWEDPEKTASSLQGGWYKTGDMGFMDENGHLHLKGRKKDMIALPDGQKVFPEDIEAILKKHSAVTDAIVVGMPRGRSIEIHAVIILQEPSQAEQVVAWANSQMAERQQIKGFTVWCEQDFPRTHTLKVKKNVVLDMISGAKPVATRIDMATQRDARLQQRDNLQRILCEISGQSVQDITSDKCLGSDLNLDSLRRVELLSVIEAELGVYVDESQVGPSTTVGQLQALVAEGGGQQVTTKFPSWGRSPWCCLLRGMLLRAMFFPLLKITYSLKVTGREQVRDSGGPLLFAANHNLHLDNGLILMAMGSRRRRLAIAAWAQGFRSPFFAVINPLLGNGFPFSQEGAIRPSLNNVGRILDEGWSVLIYPEGKLTIGGPIQPFKSGTGFVALETGLPVVPIKLAIEKIGRPWQFPVLERGKIEIRFGKPLTFTQNISYLEATAMLEEAIKAL
ncbi:MAG: AMP-binding protein [Dehalococcoidia bacterium]|nr:AMP-binding protein [Dehalococcoidia bacterium]